MRKLVVLDGYALNPGDLSWDAISNLTEITVHERTSPREVVERARGAELVLTNKTPVTAESIAALPALRYIGVLATGYNIVDVAAARARGIAVTNIPTYGTDSVAQFAIALLLELCHHAGAHSAAVRSGEWSRSKDWSYWNSPLVELAGKTLGVVGYGRIGRRTAEIAQALGMRVVAHDQPGTVPGTGVEMLGLEELLSQSDVVTLHCPLTPENKGMMNRERLARMRPSAFFLNTSRGPLVVEEDLAKALNEGRIAGAAVDVLNTEPPVNGSPLFAAKNCIITPHIAWATKEARTRLMQITAENIQAWLSGSPINQVN